MTMPIHMNGAAVGTVAFWRSVAPHYGCRTWREAMRRFALQHGKAIAHLADDSARFVERAPSRKDGIVIHHLPKESVRWHRG